MRVYEFSKKIGISNKELIKMLQGGGFEIQNHMSVLNEDAILYLKKEIQSKQLDKPVIRKKNTEDIQKNKSKPEAKSIQNQKIITLEKKIHIQERSLVDKKSLEEGSIKDEVLHKEQKIKIPIKATMLTELAQALNVSSNELILSLLKTGFAYNKNQVLPSDVVELVVKTFGAEVLKEEKKAIVFDVVKSGKILKKRPPVVVVIGHVDHGKTTLLDFIRKSRVAAKEKGGITQHLGAYQVPTKQGNIIFLDTPGHEAFTMLRGRGIRVADIAILVVAADDGIMPQTVESIKLAQSKNIPIIVALNKIDKADDVRIEQVKNQLNKHGLMPEEWGGQTIFVPISAKLGQGIDQLLDMIVLQSELMDLTADETMEACGYVLESKLEKGLGPVATFISQHGIIKIGDYFVCGNTYGKVTILVDSNSNRVKGIEPSIPVQVSGFEELPQAGDYLQVISFDDYKKIKAGKVDKKSVLPLKAIPKEAINIILKTDNDSSKEAILNSVSQLSKKDDREVYVVYSGVGNINETDILLASNVNAVVYGFGVKPEVNVLSLIQKHNVSIRLFDIIYRLFDDIKDLIKSKREIQYKQIKTGEAVVRKVFDIKGIGVISGFYVKEGKIVKDGHLQIFRSNKKIGEGVVKTLQRDKRSMKEISSGFEGALIVDGYQDWTVDDRIECFVKIPIE